VTFAPEKSEAPSPPKTEAPSPVWTVASIALVGLGLTGGAFALGFDLAANGDVRDMRKDPKDGGCAPNCPQDRVDAAKHKYTMAAAFGIAGGVFLVGGVVVFLVKPSAKTTGLNLYVQPTPNGGAASLGSRF
jgi:hypothetical protein